MKRFKNTLGLMALMTATTGMTLLATSRAQPTAVATLDLVRLIQGLEQRTADEREIAAMTSASQEEFNRRLEVVNNLEKEATDAVGAAKTEAEDAWVNKRVELQAWEAVEAQSIDIEATVRMENLYRVVRLAAAELCEVEGYDLVVVDDSGSEFAKNRNSRVPLQDQVIQQIGQRRVIHASESIDITDELIVRMNNAFD